MIVDARGLICPFPVVELGKAAASQPPGTALTLLADDPVSLTDVPAWCRMRSSTLCGITEHDSYWEFEIVTARSAG